MKPFQRWESNYGKCFGGDVGGVVSAAAYVASNIFSWAEAKQMPDLQAEANKKVLDKQKADYDLIIKDQRTGLQEAINYFNNQLDILDKVDRDQFIEAFPDVPKAAEYIPVDACCVQAETIECNIGKVDRSNTYVSYVNRLHEQNDLLHCLAADPRFMVTLDIQSKSIQDLTRGILPVGDVVEVLNDTAEQASLMGRIGNTKRTTARDLGISKLRAQAAGREEFRKATAWANTVVSPQSRQHDIGEMMMTPQQRVELALHQAQLIQQSLQNKNNALAQKKPFKLALLQARMQKIITKLQSKSTKALLVNTHVPNYAATITPNLTNYSQLVGGIGQAVQAAQQSHFFGGPPTSQTGYSGGYGATTPAPKTTEADPNYSF